MNTNMDIVVIEYPLSKWSSVWNNILLLVVSLAWRNCSSTAIVCVPQEEQEKKRKETKIVTDASSGGKKRRSKNWTRSRLCEDCELVLHGHKQQRRNSNHFFLMYAVYLWRAELLTKVQRHRKKEGEEKRRRKKEKRKKEARTNKWEGNRNDTLLLLLLFTFVK
jgi:hypothetical protein